MAAAADGGGATDPAQLLEAEFDSWREAAPPEHASVICLISIDAGPSGTKAAMLLDSEHEFTVMLPEGYPSSSDGFFFETSSSQALWCNCVNEFALERSSLSFRDVLDKAAKLYTETRSGGGGSSGGGGLSGDDDEYGDEDDLSEDFEMSEDDDDSAFTTGWELKVTKMKKVWTAKEAELRQALKDQEAQEKAKKIGAGSQESLITVVLPTTAETDQAEQIFSTAAASSILVNDLVRILELKDQNGVQAEAIQDNIYSWRVLLTGFDPKSPLAEDAKQLQAAYGYDYIELQLDFALDLFPFYPPNVKVVRPRLEDAMMQRVASLESIKLSNWNPTTNMLALLLNIKQILEQYARLSVSHPMNDRANFPDGSYFALEHTLLRLAMASELAPRANSKYQVSVSKAPRVMSKAEQAKKEAEKTQGAAAAAGTTFWAAGTGYGHGSRHQTTWDPAAHLAARKEKDNQIVQVLTRCLEGLQTLTTSGLAPVDAYPILEGSCLVPFLESQLRVTSLLEITRHARLFEAVLSILQEFARIEPFVPLLGQLPEQKASLHTLLCEQRKQLEIFLSRVQKGSATATGPVKGTDVTMSPEALTAKAIIDVAKTCQTALERLGVAMATPPSASGASSGQVKGKGKARETSPAPSAEEAYLSCLRPLQLDTSEFSPSGAFKHVHRDEAVGAGSQKRILRIAQELSALSSALPLNMSSSVFVRSDEEKVHLMRALITGPEGTPYSGGCFMFDISFPATYPNDPPRVIITTTNSGQVRFNPNLYSNGKVCLSLLGTWQGQAGENWSPDSSTLLQVLVSIQSLILVPEPYFNEPGYESEIGTPAGKSHNAEYNARVRCNTIKCAMLQQLDHPDPAFREVIEGHFYHQRDRIRDQVTQWLQEAEAMAKEAKADKARAAAAGGIFSETPMSSPAELKRMVGKLTEKLKQLKPPS